MTILLNYRPVPSQPTGIGVYAEAIRPTLQELAHVLIRGNKTGDTIQRVKRLLWTQRVLPQLANNQGASLIFTPAPEGYLGNQSIRQVVTVHDLRPMSHPEPSLQSLYFRTVVPALIDQCHHILTNTSFTANEIIKRTGIPAQKISIVPLGYDESAFFQVNSDINCSRLSSYFLHVGQQYPHKNIRRLIYSFSQIAVKHKNIRLVLAGKPHHTETPRLHRMVSELRMEQRISFQQYVKFRELPDLYRGAIALIYPSLTEGFGLPILEAMACGTPVITSLGSGTEEVAGDAALLVDAKNTREIAGAISEIINNATLRQEMTIQGLQRCKQFSWYRTAKTTRDILSCFLS